jgi:hypothetical protein
MYSTVVALGVAAILFAINIVETGAVFRFGKQGI